MKAEINKKEYRKTIEKINGTKSYFLEEDQQSHRS